MPPDRTEAGRSLRSLLSGLRTGRAVALLITVLAVIGLLIWYSFAAGRRTEPLQQWVEEQNFVFLVPASGSALPGCAAFLYEGMPPSLNKRQTLGGCGRGKLIRNNVGECATIAHPSTSTKAFHPRVEPRETGYCRRERCYKG